MSELSYFLAGILLVIGILFCWLIYHLRQRSIIQDRRLNVYKQDMADLQKQVEILTLQVNDFHERMDRINGHNSRSKVHYGYNVKHAVETMALETDELIQVLKAAADRAETILGINQSVRQGKFDPDKPERDYGKKEDKS